MNIRTIRSDIPNDRLIIGCVRDTQIIVGEMAFQAFASALYSKLLSKAEVDFMVAAGCSGAWEAIAKMQPLFGLDEFGSPCFVEAGILRPKEDKQEVDGA